MGSGHQVRSWHRGRVWVESQYNIQQSSIVEHKANWRASIPTDCVPSPELPARGLGSDLNLLHSFMGSGHQVRSWDGCAVLVTFAYVCLRQATSASRIDI